MSARPGRARYRGSEDQLEDLVLERPPNRRCRRPRTTESSRLNKGGGRNRDRQRFRDRPGGSPAQVCRSPCPRECHFLQRRQTGDPSSLHARLVGDSVIPLANFSSWLIPVLALPLAKRPLPAMEVDITRWWPVRPLQVNTGRTGASPGRSAPGGEADEIRGKADVAARRSAFGGRAVVPATWSELCL